MFKVFFPKILITFCGQTAGVLRFFSKISSLLPWLWIFHTPLVSKFQICVLRWWLFIRWLVGFCTWEGFTALLMIPFISKYFVSFTDQFPRHTTVCFQAIVRVYFFCYFVINYCIASGDISLSECHWFTFIISPLCLLNRICNFQFLIPAKGR